MNGNSNRIQELEGLVRYHADLYFNKNTPEITDAEFDALVAELNGLAPDSPVLGEVGAVPSYGKKVTHERPMGSLEKVKSSGEVEAWLKEYSKSSQVVVTPKMDGVACSLRYKDGILVLAATRGNGCLRGDSLIETEDGRNVSIQEIVSRRVKCRVKCIDVSTGEVCFREVNDYFVNGQSDEWIEVVVVNETGERRKLTLTPDHQVLSSDGGHLHFVRAENLREGENVFGS